VFPISGISPITGETVDGETLKKEYDSIKEELMQVLRQHKLTAGQAKHVLGICRENIDIVMNAIVDF